MSDIWMGSLEEAKDKGNARPKVPVGRMFLVCVIFPREVWIVRSNNADSDPTFFAE
jgi:hypothetical protein